jgi:hypothetical protein
VKLGEVLTFCKWIHVPWPLRITQLAEKAPLHGDLWATNALLVLHQC